MKQYLIVTPDIYELPLAVHNSVKEISTTYGIPLQTVYTAIRDNSVNRKINARIEEVEVGFYLGDTMCATTNSAQKKSTLVVNKSNKTNRRNRLTTKRRLSLTLNKKTYEKIEALASTNHISISCCINRLVEGAIL